MAIMPGKIHKTAKNFTLKILKFSVKFQNLFA